MDLQRLAGIEGTFTGLINSFKSFGKALLLSKWGLKLPPPTPAQGQNLFVIGNGPSFKQALEQHGQTLKQQTTLGVNLLPLTPYFEQVQPDYLLAMDKKFWLDRPQDPALENYRKYFAALQTNTTWPLTVILPVQARGYVQKLGLSNPHLSFAYFNKNGTDGLDALLFPLWKRHLASPRCWNILIAALYLGVNLGYKKVYLLGADHSWFENLAVNAQNRVQMKQVHFYDDHQEVKYLPYVNAELNRPMTMPELFRQFYVVFNTYHILRRYAAHYGSHISNLTPGSYIDAFERQELAQVLQKL